MPLWNEVNRISLWRGGQRSDRLRVETTSVPQMKYALSHGLWGKTAPSPLTQPNLAEDIQCDVAIIGAGYTGLSAALHLAERGLSAVVVEAESVGFGGSGRNVGLVNAGMWVMPDTLKQVLGSDLGGRMLAFLGEGPAEVFGIVDRYGIECEAQRAGTLHCAVGAKGLVDINQRATQWQQLKAPVEVLQSASAAEKLGSSAFAGALWDHRAGTIQPLGYARGLARMALALGAQIYEGTPVTGMQASKDGWHLTTPEGSVRAGWVIGATNIYSTQVHSDLATSQTVLPYFNMATAPLSAGLRASILPEGQGAWDTRSVLTSFRTDAAGRLIFGSVGQLGMEASCHKAFARRSLLAMYPQLNSVEFEHFWWGKIGMTADNLPRLARLGHQALAVGGYNGRGIAPGTVYGRALAQHIVGDMALEDIPVPVRDLTPEPFRTIKGLGIRAGAAALHTVAQRV